MPQDENKIRLADALAKAEETNEVNDYYIPVVKGDGTGESVLNKIKADDIADISELENRVSDLETEITDKADQTNLKKLANDLEENYYTKSDADSRFISEEKYESFITSDELDSALDNYYTKSDIEDKGYLTDADLSEYAKTSDVEELLSDTLDNYVTKEEYESDKSDLYNKLSDLEETKADKSELSDYYTKSETDTLLDTKVDKSEYNSDMEIIDEFIDNTDSNIQNLYDTKADKSQLSDYYTKDEIDSDFVTFGQLEERLGDYYTSGQIEEKISEFLTSADLDDYVTGSDLTNILSDYVTQSDLDSTLSDYVTEEELNNILSDYVTQSDLDEVMEIVFGNLSDLDETKADKSELDNYYTKDEIDNMFSDTPTDSDYVELRNRITAAENNIEDLDSDLDSLTDRVSQNETDIESLSNDKADKTDTYTKDETDELLESYETIENHNEDIADLQEQIDELGSGIARVMRYKGTVYDYDELPTSDNEIGDVWNVEDTDYNYAWNGNDWDRLSPIIDISGKADRSELNALTDDLHNNYYDSDDIDTMLSTKADESELDNYVTTSDHNSDIDNLQSQIDELSSGKADKSELDNYYTKSDVDDLTSDFVNHSELESFIDENELEEYVTNATSDFVTHSELENATSDFVTTSELSDAISDFITSDALDNYVTSDKLNDYYTSGEVDDLISDFATHSELENATSDFVTHSEIADFVTTSDLEDAISDFVTTDALDNYVTSGVYNSGINDLQEQIDDLRSDIDILSDSLDDFVTKDYLSDNYYTSGQIDEMFENIDLTDLTNVKNYTIDNAENVIVINPNLNSDEEVTGKLYATFEVARDYTSSSGNADKNFIIKLPADEFYEHIIVDENMTIIGNKTKLYGGVDSTCELPYTGVVKNCVVGYNNMHIGIVSNGVNILGLTGNNSSNNYKGAVTFVECEVGTEWWDCEDSDTTHYNPSHVLKDVVVIDHCYIFGKEYSPRSVDTKAVQYNVNIVNSIIGSKGQPQSDFRIGLDWAIPTAYLNNLKSTISISNTIIERDISFVCFKAKINLKLNNVISQYRQKFIDRGPGDWFNTISLNNCNFKVYFDGYKSTPEINECNIDELSIYDTDAYRIANSNVKLLYTYDSTSLYVNEHSTIKIDDSFSNSYGNCNIYLDHCSHLVEPENPTSGIGAYIVNYSSDNIDKQIDDLKTNIVTIANGDSSISNNECSLTLSNNTIYDISATGLNSIVIATPTGTLDFISQLNFATYNNSGIKPTLTLSQNSKIIDTNDCIDSILSNTITFITNYRITMICYYDGSQYRFVFQGA